MENILNQINELPVEQLANNPSPRNWTLTQNALKRFSYQFKSVLFKKKL